MTMERRRAGRLPIRDTSARIFILFLVLTALAGLVFAGAGCKSSGRGKGVKPVIFVSILPQKYFVDRVSGGRVQVEVLVQPGQSPHNYEPTQKQIAMLSDADIYFTIGVPFEQAFVKNMKQQKSDLNVVDTTRGIERIAGEEHGHHGHGHEESDPHVWLSPVLAKKIAAATCDELSRFLPDFAAEFEKNRDDLLADLDRVHAQIKKTLAPYKGQTFYVFHPAFGYFAHEYGLHQEAVEQGGKEPTQKQLARLISDAKKHDVKIIYVQKQFPKDMAEKLAREIGGAVVPMDPLAGDYLDNLEAMAAALEKGLK